MKKLIAILVAIAMVITVGAGVALANNSNSEQGVPSAKAATAVGQPVYDSSGGTQGWTNVLGLETTIKCSSVSYLVVTVSAETALVTDVKIKGTGSDQSSTSNAEVDIRVGYDNNDGNWVYSDVSPDSVVFGSRTMKLSGLLWDSSTLGMTDLPQQYIEIWDSTENANSFTFFIPDAGVGVHNVKVQIKTSESSGFTGGDMGAGIGNSTLVVEADRIN